MVANNTRPQHRCQRPGRILATVTPLQRYLAEEIATDHVDGLLTRREAMRRLALLGLTTTAAAALIAVLRRSA